MQLARDIFTAPATSIHAHGEHLFWTENPSESLVKSMEEFGQTTPVLVTETSDGLSLAAGAARLAVLTRTGQPVLARLVVDATPLDMGLLYLADNAQRTVDDGMRLRALQYFAPLMPPASLQEDILPRLGVRPRSKDTRLLTAWLNMDAQWQTLLAAGNVPLAAGAPLAQMTDEDRRAVEPLFTGFSWSRSNAVNILTWLHETAKMTGSSVREVVKKAGVDTILRQGLSPKDAIARLSSAAQQARFPELSALRDRFAQASAGITAGTRWRMTQPNHFETGGCELSVQLKDRAQLTQALADLEAMATLPAWKTVWNLGSRND